MQKERFKKPLNDLSALAHMIAMTADRREANDAVPSIEYLRSIGLNLLSIKEELIDAIYEETHDEHVVDVLKDVRDRIDHLIKREEL